MTFPRSKVLRRRYCPKCRCVGVTQLHGIVATHDGADAAFASVVPERMSAIFVHRHCEADAKDPNPAWMVELKGPREVNYLRRRWGLREIFDVRR